MDGKALAARIRGQVAEDVRPLGRLGLATILVGDDPASHVYIRLKHEAAEEAGIEAIDRRLPADVTEGELLELVARLNDDVAVDGILVQLPLPEHVDEAAVLRAVDPLKDVDGYHPYNAGHLYAGRPTLVPATPVGIMSLLAEYEIPLTGARAVVVGRHTREADVLVAAVGIPGVIEPEMVKPGAAVVDVGINRTEVGLVGDVDPRAAERAAFITPVPGGVGPMTVASLLANTVLAARYRRRL